MAASSAAPASASASAPTTTTAAATTNNPDVAVAAKVDERRKRSRRLYGIRFGLAAAPVAWPPASRTRLIWVRLQMRKGNAPKNMSGTFVHIIKNDGPLALYSGISASLLRQLTYSTPSFPALIAMAMGSGFLGGIAGNFADVLNVRMQHDAALPPAERRNYRHAVDGMARMAREEGP
ncbi:hypothetical protein ACCO45_004976 [Purpureocillium lilacinum]|uniref:Uncharacterized protein n=1 Tax=Purpureocillium lilacinum TaxID=33203 RepID=A0ACC4DVC9_PURLI